MDNQTELWPGWKTVRAIGKGCFGTVFEIEREILGETEKAAVKRIMIPQNNRDVDALLSEGYDLANIKTTYQECMKSILAEYRRMRKMNGFPYCDDIRYVQHDDGIGWDIFIKMELLTPLIKTLPNQLNDDIVISIGKDLCNALIQCEENNIIHQDIKPQNIFVTQDGIYKLGDISIAKHFEKINDSTIIGAKPFMAPEFYNNQSYGKSADIYSLGMVLYWLSNNKTYPFLPPPPQIPTAGQRQLAIMKLISGEQIPLPLNGSPELKKIILKACAYDAKERYQTASELLRELQNIKLLSLSEDIPEIDEPTLLVRNRKNNHPKQIKNDIWIKHLLCNHQKSMQHLKWMLPVAGILLVFTVFFFSRNTHIAPDASLYHSQSTVEPSSNPISDNIQSTTSVPEDEVHTEEEEQSVHTGSSQETSPNMLGNKAEKQINQELAKNKNELSHDWFDALGLFKNSVSSITIHNSYSDIPQSAIDVSSDNSGNVKAWAEEKGSNLDVYVASTDEIFAPEDSRRLFSEFENVQTIDLSGLNTQNVRNMSSMFEQCKSLETVNLSSFDTSNVRNMSKMFYACFSLESLDLSGFNTANVENMSDLFSLCLSIEELDLSSFDTSNVYDMSDLFQGCSHMTSVNVSGFDTSKVKYMDNMFASCTRLKMVDVSSFNYDNVASMWGMFFNCPELPQDKIPAWYKE